MPANVQFAKKSWQAVGRLKSGEMNRTEKAYSAMLELRKKSGEIAEFWFESWKFKIADNACWYVPDFVVMLADGRLEAHEVKGSPKIFTDDAKVKVKVFVSLYPLKTIVAFPRAKSKGGGWEFQEF